MKKITIRKLLDSTLILSFVLISALFSGCDILSNLGKEQEETSQEESFSFEITETGMTYARIQMATGTEYTENIKYIGYTLTNGETEVDRSYYYEDFTVKFTNLTPDTEYTLSLTYNTKDYKTINKTYSIKTKAFQTPEIQRYSSYSANFSTYEKISSLFDSVKVMRSTNEESGYEEITVSQSTTTISDGVVYTDDTKLLSNTKYYYTFIFKKGETEYKSGPVLYETGTLLPSQVTSVNTKSGFTSVAISWEKGINAEWYKVEVSSSTWSFTADVDSQDNITENTYTLKKLEPGKTYSVRIYSYNEAYKNSSIYSSTSFTTLTPKIKSFNVIPAQTEAVYEIISNDEKNPNDEVTVEYYVKSSDSSTAEILAGPSSEPVLTRTGLSPEEWYYSSSSGKYSAGYVYMVIKYTDKDGNEKEYAMKKNSYSDSYYKTFYTRGYDAVTDLKIEEIKSTSAKLSFTPLSGDQLLGKPALKYMAYAVDGEENIKSSSDFNSSPVTIENLEPGRNYTFKLVAFYNSSNISVFADYLNFAEIEGATDSGLSAITGVTVSEAEAALPIKTNLTVKWNKINEDDGTGNVSYGVEYKVMKKSKWRKFINASDNYSTKFTGVYEAANPVNGGNRYIVRVFAYKVSEPACIVYSDEIEFQCEKINDSAIPTALIYPEGTEKAGEIIDFTDGSVWEGGKSPKSTTSEGYNFGITQFLGATNNTHFVLPTGDVAFFAFKFSFDEGIDSNNIPRIIFLDSYGFGPGVTEAYNYGYFKNIFIIQPDSDAFIEKTYGETETNPNVDIWKETNMPSFNYKNGKLTAITSAASSGVPVEENWLFNNSVYIGVQQKSVGNIGFSYYY